MARCPLTTRPALTVIDGGRAHEPPRQRGPRPSEAMLEAARALARSDAMRLMGEPETELTAIHS